MATTNHVWLKCNACGKDFWVYKSKIRRKYKKHFCSIKCYHLSKGGAGNPNWKNRKKEERQCCYCGKEFLYQSYISERKHSGKYCSKNCLHLSLIKKYTKNEAKIILTELEKSPLSLPEFAKMKKTTERTLKRMITEYYPDEYETVQEHRRLKKDEWYRKGRAFERKVRIFMQKSGYIVMPSPRSLGAADLLAVQTGEILLVQCKLYGQLPKPERLSLEKMSRKAGGLALMATQKEGKIMFNIPNEREGRKRKSFKLKKGEEH